MINYYLLTKPGIIFGNLLTVAAGFFLGSRGIFDPGLFLATLVGIACVIGSACVFNNYIDRNFDQKMTRTKNRALVRGLITEYQALLYGSILGIIGMAVLCIWTNWLAASLAALGFFIYVGIYSLWKSKTVYGTAIGSLAGALPPVIGYCAAHGEGDLAAILLFLILVFWQMPHFFSIALMHLDDYTKAEIPVLPVVKGVQRTKIHMVLYILVFIPLVIALSLLGYTGKIFLIVTAITSVAWLILCLSGFYTSHQQQWNRHMFRFSLLMILVICCAIPF